MHAERDHLVKVTFPRLRQWCEQRRLHLDDIDLRWGLTSEQAASGRVIDICLQQIDDCRPFFVCMLGTRYGLTADQLPERHLDSLPGFALATDKSVTHLEIEYATAGALDGQNERQKVPCEYAFFYFRDPNCVPRAKNLTGYTQKQRELHETTFFTLEPIRRKMLADLKNRIRKQFQRHGRVFDYSGVWNPEADNPQDDELKGRLTDLEAFGDRVEADIKQAIEIRFSKHFANLGRQNSLSEERSYHDAFVENRMRGHGTSNFVYFPAPEIDNAITSYVHGDDSRPLVLIGPAGSGKSAALAYWAKTHQDAGDAFVISRFIGASPSSTNLHRLLTNLSEELNQQFRLRQDIPADPKALREKWPSILAESGKCGKVVILLDALNQLDRMEKPSEATWLQEALPPGVRLVVSVLHEEARSVPKSSRDVHDSHWLAFLRRNGCIEVSLPRLTAHQQRSIVNRVPLLWAKTLENKHVQQLLDNPATQNPLFLLVALHELRVFGSFAKLEQVISGLPRPDQGDGAIESAVEQMFDRVLARLEEETNPTAPGLVEIVFGWLASAREGLAEEELGNLLRVNLSSVPEQDREGSLQVVLRQVRPYLLRKRSQRAALVDFFHRSFWKAARQRYLAENASRRRSHMDLADYFEKQPDWIDGKPNERKVVELLWHRIRVLEIAANEGAASTLKAAWHPLVRLLNDQSLLTATCGLGLEYELLDEFHDVFQNLGELQNELGPSAVQGLLSLLTAHHGRNHAVLNLVAIQSFFAYRTDDRKFYKMLLLQAISSDWIEQCDDPAAGEKLASEAAVDYCGLLRREGNVEEAEARLPQILERIENAGNLLALCRGEYEFAYIYFMRHEFREAARIFERSADHSFKNDPPHTVGGWVSRCLQFRASYLARNCSAQDFRALLMQAAEQFELHQDSDFARRWIMNYKAHLFELAFAEEDATAAGELLEGIQRSRWMQERGEMERTLRLLPYNARRAMLEGDWKATVRYFEAYLDVPNPVWNSKAGEAIAREFLDFGVALVEQRRPEEAKRVWQRGLDCPDKLANKIWKKLIQEAQEAHRRHDCLATTTSPAPRQLTFPC